jgi:hypothetical protein
LKQRGLLGWTSEWVRILTASEVSLWLLDPGEVVGVLGRAVQDGGGMFG